MKGVPPKHTQFKPGQSGNPKGRPKLPDIKGVLAKILNGDEDGMPALEAILKALVKKAKNGDVRAAQELFDRAFGKAQQYVDHTTGGRGMVNIPIIHWVNSGNDNDKIKDSKVLNKENITS